MKNINQRLKELGETPLWIKIILGVFTFLVGLSQLSGWTLRDIWAPSEKIHSVGVIENISTSTIPISEIITKTLAQGTFVEQGDFLEKYQGTAITGHGRVTNVARAGEGFLVDIRTWIGIKKNLLTCSVIGDEKEILLLKGKVVDFKGTFSGSVIWNHGLGMGDCLINW